MTFLTETFHVDISVEFSLIISIVENLFFTTLFSTWFSTLHLPLIPLIRVTFTQTLAYNY